ncbi:MAG TPA: universal stress protein [Candidatus Binataceae bacterium]|jgi:nucleotide-binding universal stress UspA family protein|nr:universal stress protein [Candidatus Binataceae bacterium]
MAHPFRKLFCPVDFGPNTDLSIDTALQIAEPGGRLILFHVVPLPVPALGQPVMLEPISGAEHDARERLTQLGAKRLDGKIPYEVEVITGDPAVEIMVAAAEHQADLIVMATHGRTGLSHFFLGSVAERVVRESTVPVLTVRAEGEKKKAPLSPSVIL